MSVHEATVFDVLKRTVGEAGGLASTLGALAASEVGDSVGKIAKGVAGLVAGMFIGLIGMLFLLHACVAYLVQRGMSEAMAYLAVGGGAILMGLVVLLIGVLFLKGASPVPHRTIRQVRSLLGQESTVA